MAMKSLSVMQTGSQMYNLQPTTKQSAILALRNNCHLMSVGGRGGGKSETLVMDVVLHCQDFGFQARPIVAA